MCFDYAIRSEKGHHWLQNGMALSFLLTLAGTINGCSEVVNKHASHPNVIAMWSVHSSDRKTFDSQKYVQNIKESKLDNPLDGEWTMVDIKSDNGKENVVAVEKKLTNNREPTMFLTHKERRKNFGATMFSKSPKLFFSADSSFPENIYIQKHLALTNKPHTPKIKITHTNNLISEHSVSLQDKTLRHSKHHNLAVNQKNYTNENKFGTYISKKENPKVENSKFESSISTNNFLGFIKMADKHKNRTSEISTVKKDKAHFGNNYENEIKLTPIRHRQRHLFKKSPPDYIGNLNENWRTLTIPAGSQSPKGRDAFSPKDKFLILFGQIEEEIMRQTRICGSHTSVNLLDTYNLLELSYPSNYNRVVIFYINVISITKGKIDLSLRRVKSIIDNFLASNNVITIMNLYPENEQLIYKTLQIRQSEITELILNMNDEILEYCDHYSPTCIAENSLGQVFWALHQTHKLDANYQLNNLQYFEKRFCSPTFACEPNLNENASPNAMFKTQRDQLKDVAEALCLLPHHRIVEFVLNESETASNVYDEFGREIGDGQSSDKRAITQTGLLLKDILPLDLKYYDKNRPPKFEGQPTVVYFHVTVLSIDSISEDSMTYVADIFLAQSWRDHRLRLPGNMTEEYRILDVEWLHDIWRPDCFFKNAKQVTFHEMSVPNHYLWLYHDKTLLYMAKLTLVLSCAMKFETYPHDTQICSMMIESLSHTTHDLVFKWNETDPLVMNSDIELPQLDISRNTTEDCTLTYSTGNFTCLAVVFNLRRRLGYHLFHTYIPSAITVVMSWISFWIKPEAIPARVTLGVTSLLTLATQNQQSQSSLPPVSYIKAIDVWMSSCTVFVFASLLEFGLVNHFMNSEPIGKDMTGYSMEDLTDFDDRKLSDVSGGLNSFNSRSKSRLGSHSYRLRSRSPGQPQYVVTRCTGKDIAIYIDKFSRIFFPVSFCILNISYWTTYGNL